MVVTDGVADADRAGTTSQGQDQRDQEEDDNDGDDAQQDPPDPVMPDVLRRRSFAIVPACRRSRCHITVGNTHPPIVLQNAPRDQGGRSSQHDEQVFVVLP